MTPDQKNTAMLLQAAISCANDDGIFDLMVGSVNNPDSINDFIDTLEELIEQSADH